MTFGEGPLLRKNIKFFQNVEKNPNIVTLRVHGRNIEKDEINMTR